MAAQAARRVGDPNAPNDPAVEAAFQAVPDLMVGEILDGKLYTSPRPGRRQTRAKSILGALLTGAFWQGKDGPGGWMILDEPEIHVGPGPDKIVSDIAGWRNERMPDEIRDDDPYYYDVTPNWTCEILSASTASRDRLQKMNIYRRERVPHVWLIHPVLRTLEVYRFEVDHYGLVNTFGEDQVVRAEPFDAIELPLQILWMGPAPQ